MDRADLVGRGRNVERRDIPGLEGAYAATSDGQIISLARKVPFERNGAEYTRRLPERVLRQTIDRYGYANVAPYRDGVSHATGVHRLICMAFHGSPPSPDLQAAHCDGDKLNNRPENLRWATPAENNEDRRLHGNHPMGNVLPHAKLTPAKVREVVRLHRLGQSNRSIGKRFGVTDVAIRKVVTGRSWRHVTGFSPASPILAEIARLKGEV